MLKFIKVKINKNKSVLSNKDSFILQIGADHFKLNHIKLYHFKLDYTKLGHFKLLI